MRRVYPVPSVMICGDVVRTTLGPKAIGFTETFVRRPAYSANLSFGL